LYSISLGFCPEHLWVGSGVTLPVVVDEANGYEPHIICRIVVAIEALGIKAVQLLANKVVQVLCHVGFQVVFLCLLRLMVPVSSLAEHLGLVVDESLSHLGDAEHRAVLVCHPGIHRGVDVKPFLHEPPFVNAFRNLRCVVDGERLIAHEINEQRFLPTFVLEPVEHGDAVEQMAGSYHKRHDESPQRMKEERSTFNATNSTLHCR